MKRSSSVPVIRALDALEPPDLWPEITERAARPAGRPSPFEPPRRSRFLIGVAAVAAGVVGVVGVAALAARDRHEEEVVTSATSEDDGERDVAPATEGRPYDATAMVQPDRMRAEPAVAAAGERVELHFPGGLERGVAFVLEARTGDHWELRYYLVASSAAYTPDGPTWAPADAEFGWVDLGVGGPGPDAVSVPDTAPPGDYRICTANAVENVCAAITIVER